MTTVCDAVVVAVILTVTHGGLYHRIFNNLHKLAVALSLPCDNLNALSPHEEGNTRKIK